jgi:hypothetical protein
LTVPAGVALSPSGQRNSAAAGSDGYAELVVLAERHSETNP